MHKLIEIKAHIGGGGPVGKSHRPQVLRRTDRFGVSAESDSRRQQPTGLSQVADAVLRLTSEIQVETLRMRFDAVRRSLRALQR